MNAQQELNSYRNIDLLSELEAASRYRLAQIVLMRAIEQLNRAQYASATGDLIVKRDANSRAIGLIDTLRESLTAEQNHEINTNLENLYGYMIEQLLVANDNDDPSILERVVGLLTTVKSAWDELPKIIKQQPQLADQLKEYFHVS